MRKITVLAVIVFVLLLANPVTSVSHGDGGHRGGAVYSGSAGYRGGGSYPWRGTYYRGGTSYRGRAGSYSGRGAYPQSMPYYGRGGYYRGSPYYGKGGYYHGGHHHGGYWSGGVWIAPGFGWYYGGPWWGWPYYPYYPYYTYPPVVVENPPPIYVDPTPEQQEPGYWYYCKNPEGYYPYVQQCPGGWTKVSPSPMPPDVKE